jgi:hypothetical protein
VQLLQGLEQDITITGLYSTALSEIRPHAEKHESRVADLLDLYETAGRGKLTTHTIDAGESPDKVAALLTRLIEKPAYKDEAAPHAEALEAFPETGGRIAELMQNELGAIERLAGADPRVTQMRTLGIIERNFRVMMRKAQDTQADVQALQNEEIPRYGQAVDLVSDYLEQTQQVLQDAQGWITGDGVNEPGISEETRAFFAGATGRYQPVLTEIETELDQTKDLEPVKLEELHGNLTRENPVLVETAEEALVLAYEEVWPWRMDQNAPPPPDGDRRDFAGEQAISSAILKMTQKEKTAVVFTRFGGQSLLTAPMPPQGNPMMRMPQAPYQIVNELLQKENFVTEEWDVQTQVEPPEIEDAARVIYVVFPPQAPQQSNPMRPAPTPPINAEQKQRIYDAVTESSMAVFLTSWQPPTSPFNPTPAKYELNDYLKSDWGIEVTDSHLALEFVPNPQTEGLKYPAGRGALISSNVFQYTAHPIGEPLRGLPAALQMVAPLGLVSGDDRPEGVTVETIIDVPPSEDVWAIGNLGRINEDLQKNQGTRQYDDDIPSPFPLAVAATSEKGSRLVVLASDSFIADSVLNMSQMVLVGGGLRMAKLYPGNPDLFINALHWLTGEADRIAVGPQPSDVPRLDELKDDGTLTFTRVFLVAIWPGLALLVGAGVWLMRRR